MSIKLIKSTFFSIFYVSLLIFFVAGTFVSLNYDFRKQNETSALQDIYNKQVQENNSLKKEYSYYSSDLFIQKEAIDNLNLAGKNSTLVVVNTPVAKESKKGTNQSSSSSSQTFKEWLDLLN